MLYEDGTFALQYSSGRSRFFEYRGRYSETQSCVTFEFDGGGPAGPWIAVGEVTSDRLEVRFSILMQLDDFENGMYLRSPA